MITREFLKSVNFRVMNEFDRQGFAGAMSPVALIGEIDDYLVVIDGPYCEVYGPATDDGTFEPIDTCDDIRDLPF